MSIEPNAARELSTHDVVDPVLSIGDDEFENSRMRLADWRTGIAIALVLFLFYAGFNQGRFKSTDETGVFYVTESLYERRTLAVPVHIHAHAGSDGRLYAPFAIGQSILALPFYAMAKGARGPARGLVEGDRWLELKSHIRLPPFKGARVSATMPAGGPSIQHSTFGGTLEVFFVGLYAPFISALLAMAIYGLLRRLWVSRRSALLTTFLVCACSYPAMQSVYFLRHTSAIFCVVLAFEMIREFIVTGNQHVLAVGCAFASLTFLVRFPGVLAGPAIGLYVGRSLWVRHRDLSRPWIPDLLAVALFHYSSVSEFMSRSTRRGGEP